jgi:glycolate oxidase FAD binding subunit
MNELIEQYQQQIRHAASNDQALRIRGGGSKDFYGGPLIGDILNVAGYTGVIDYEPKELVLTVRAGTPLVEVEKLVDNAGQMLPFEPPYFGSASTIGGTVACGFSGPRRPYSGAVRDFVLGARIINGKAEDLHFGGRVIKNVAGFDVSRLMVGALGTLGVLLDLSFKVLPKPQSTRTLRFELDAATAIINMNEWAGQPLPLSATCWHEGVLQVRLSGAQVAVDAAQRNLGGDVMADDKAHAWWLALREHQHAHFAASQPLWRVSVPTTTAMHAFNGVKPPFIEWGGGLRWYSGSLDGEAVRGYAASVGGHATLFRGATDAQREAGVFQPLEAAVDKIHHRLKASFDPANTFNRKRMYVFEQAT